MISLKTSYTKNVANKLRFLLVTHMTCFDTRFDRNGIWKSGYSAELIQDRTGRGVAFSGLRPKKRELW
jgi:hypothetical protein